ncbi:MAG: 1-acyl-sn-glycerol-3-phosphate acyltransferase [Deltaproteobacteria bacterium]|nr:1-acyl-sn-glycerol-3-phosphate acyltransferase [Deltaproteobacteria bacterium]
MRKQDRERILTEVISRVVEQKVTSAGGRLDEVVADSVYHELKRLKGSDGDEAAFWKELRDGISSASERELSSLVRRVVRRYAEEICGKFDERVYDAVTRAGEPVMGMLLNAVSPKRLLEGLPSMLGGGGPPGLPGVDKSIVVQGNVAQLKTLRERGTLLLVPTHVSHMDSIAVGWALWKMGMPPFLYGAGLNLFSNPMLGFFLRNLGAYTVDRRKQDPLYKDVLKEYAQLTLENDYDNIFFPGGTRSRTGALEKRLKLGLLGTGVTAYVQNLKKKKKEKDRFYVVPATLSFQLVLEAETLIDDFLQEVGKSRYIITDDEATKPKRILDFLTQLFSLDSKIYFTVGRAIDPFGNDVDDDGNSLDPSGRVIDPRDYVIRDGEVVFDAQRDAEFTREVGERIVDAYTRDTVIQATHLCAHAALLLLRQKNPGTDLVRLLRAGGKIEDLSLRDVYLEVDRQLAEMRGLRDRSGVRLAPTLEKGSADDVVAEALRHFSTYHTQAALTRRGDRLFPTNRGLLFYYSNRLEGFRLERGLGLKPALAPDHKTLAQSPSASSSSSSRSA